MSVELSETARNTDSANAGQIGCDGENVGKVHLQWVSNAFAQLKCCYWRSRRDQCVDFFESLSEIAANQLPHLLRAQIICVVITGAQNVSTKNDSAFHFRSKTFLTCAAIKIEHILGIFRAISVTHAVETSEVRGSFRGSNNVINRNRVLRAGQ